MNVFCIEKDLFLFGETFSLKVLKCHYLISGSVFAITVLAKANLVINTNKLKIYYGC